MQYTIDSSHSISKHHRTMSNMFQHLKATRQNVSEEEQVLNVIKAQPNEN